MVGNILGKLNKLVSNKYFWYAVAAIIVLIIVRNKWQVIAGKIKSTFTPVEGDFSGKISEKRKDEIKEVAAKMAEAIDPDVKDFWSWTRTDREVIISTVYVYGDTEFYYFVKQYNDRHGNLREDLKNAWLPFTKADEELLARMDKMGL